MSRPMCCWTTAITTTCPASRRTSVSPAASRRLEAAGSELRGHKRLAVSPGRLPSEPLVATNYARHRTGGVDVLPSFHKYKGATFLERPGAEHRDLDTAEEVPVLAQVRAEAGRQAIERVFAAAAEVLAEEVGQVDGQ